MALLLLLNREDELMLCPKSLSAGEHHNISLAYPVSEPTNFSGIPTVNYSTPSKDRYHCRGILEAFSVCPASLHPKNSSPPNPCDSDEIIRKTRPSAVLITKAGTRHRRPEFFLRNRSGSWEGSKGDSSPRHWARACLTAFLLPFSNWKRVAFSFNTTSTHTKLPFLIFFCHHKHQLPGNTILLR